MASNIPVIVQGNSFSLAIPLQIYYINGDQMDLQDYTPDPTDEISIQLKGERRQYTYTPTVDGNICNIDLSGNELAGNYSVVVSIVKASGQRLRSFRTDQFFIVESSDDLTPADIIEGLEENVIYLNSSIFVAGEDGRGIENITKTSTSGLVDTYTITYTDATTSTFTVTNGAAGAQGADGVGITSIDKTGTQGLVDTYTITLSNGQTSTFDVTNGQDGHDLGLASIINNLNSDSTEDALSAAMGKVLNSNFENNQVIDAFNSGYYYSKDYRFIANASYIYSDFYPVELFEKVTGMVRNGVTANIAYFSVPSFSTQTMLGYYLGTGTSSNPQTIDKATFDANKPTGARYFAISVQSYQNIEVKLYLHSRVLDAMTNDLTVLNNHVVTKSTINAQDIMTTYEYWNKSQGKFVANSSGWKRTPYLDLDVYKRVEATIPLQANDWPLVVYFDSNKQYLRHNGWSQIPSGITTNTFVIEKTTPQDKYAVVCANIGTTQNYSFNLFTYVDKMLDGDFSNLDARFTEPRSGAQARLITSYTLNSQSTDEFLVLYCCGNTQTAESLSSIPSTALQYFREHHISIATLTYQAPLYGSQESNTGWGNEVCYNAICDLYAYLMAKYPFRKDVILVGGSMGGLTMGQLAYKKPFPIRFCLGIGPATGLEICWTKAGENYPATIRVDMRKAYGLATDGSEDSQFADVSKGYDWRTMGWVGSGKVGYPNYYIYYGTSDGVVNSLFGGAENYTTLKDALLVSGVYSMVKSKNVNHADFSIFTDSINDGIWDKELKAGI